MSDIDPSVNLPELDDDFQPGPAPSDFQGTPRRITAGEAVSTIPEAIGILARGFWPYCGMALSVILIYSVVSGIFEFLFGGIPLLGPLVLQIALPAALTLLFFGWYRAIGEREATGRTQWMRLLDGYREDPIQLALGVLAIWCAMVLVLVLAALLVAVIFAPGVFATVQRTGNVFSALGAASFMLILGMFVVMTLLAPVMSVQGLYLAAAAVGRMPVWAAVRAAIQGALRNWLPLMAVSAVSMLALVVVAMVFGFVIGGVAGLLGSRALAMFIAVPAVIVAVAWLPAFGYAMFHRIFFPPRHEEAPPRITTVRTPAPPPPEAYAAPAVDRDAPWTLALLRALDAPRFGALCIAYFRAAGFHVESRHGLQDGSARFTLASATAPEQPVMLVEAVGWGAPVDLPRMRNFREGLARNNLTRGIVVAASGFVDDAVKEAANAKIRAIDGAELLTLVMKLAPDKQQTLRDAAFPPPPAAEAA